jgi:lipopolysaccharide heptosyltransferase II
MNRIGLLKAVDRIIGVPLVSLLALFKQVRSQGSQPMGRILIIRPGGIGDAVLLIPAIRCLKAALPEVEIDVLCEKRNAGIFDLVSALGSVYRYDSGAGLFTCLRNSYDAVVDTEQWHRLSAVVARLTKAPVRIGFGTNDRRALFTHEMPYSHDDYEAISFLRLTEPLTRKPSMFKQDEPFITVDDRDLPEQFSTVLYASSDVVAIFPGASVSERKWGGKKFGKVAGALIKRGFGVVILGSQADGGEAGEIRRHAPEAVDLTGKTSLKQAAAVMRRCRLLIAADSGLMHLAVAVGTPVVALFGAGIEKKWALPGRRHRVLNARLDCSPCTKFGYTPKCERDVQCLSAITVEAVVASAEELLALSTGPRENDKILDVQK